MVNIITPEQKFIYTESQIVEWRNRLAVAYTELSLSEFSIGDEYALEDMFKAVQKGLMQLSADMSNAIHVACPLCEGTGYVVCDGVEETCPAECNNGIVTNLRAGDILVGIALLPEQERTEA